MWCANKEVNVDEKFIEKENEERQKLENEQLDIKLSKSILAVEKELKEANEQPKMARDSNNVLSSSDVSKYIKPSAEYSNALETINANVKRICILEN